MPSRPTPLPADLRGRGFSTAQARSAGLTEGRLRGRDLERPFHGVRRAAGPADGAVFPIREALLADASAAALVLPGDATFSHCTAALLHGLPLPRSHEHSSPLHVMRETRRNPVDRSQVMAHSGAESRRVETVRGLRVVSGADTWVDLATLLGVDDLVVVGDRLARLAGTVAALHEALDRRSSTRGLRGVRRLRAALPWIRTGSDSPMETRSRLLFCRHGLPEPEINVPVMASDGSGFLCRGDFVWRDKKVIGEYQGADHFAGFARRDSDISRRLLLEDDGWKHIELTRADHMNPARRWAMLQRLGSYLGVDMVVDRPQPDWERRFGTTSTGCG